MKNIIGQKTQSIAIALSLLLGLIFMPNSIQAKSSYIPVQLYRPFKSNGWIYARGSAAAYETFAKMEITVTLHQRYGGRWHEVAKRKGKLYNTSGIQLANPIAVRCTGAQTTYSFLAEVRVVGTRTDGSTAVGENMLGNWLTC